MLTRELTDGEISVFPSLEATAAIGTRAVVVFSLIRFSNTREIASAQENIREPLSQDGDGQRMPRNCSKIALESMPERNAKDTNRPIASNWLAAQPPALPICVKISKGLPSSSLLIVT